MCVELPCHGDVQLHESVQAAAVLRSQHAEAERSNTRLTEQVAEICGGRWAAGRFDDTMIMHALHTADAIAILQSALTDEAVCLFVRIRSYCL